MVPRLSGTDVPRRPVKRIACFTNQYPKVSHAFVRREIRALEDHGVEVLRWSVRPTPDKLVDPADIEEQRQTRIMLGDNKSQLATALAKEMATNSELFFPAAALADQLGKASTRRAVHGAYLAEACLLKQWAEAAEVEHVHVHFGTNPAAVALLSRMLGGPSYSFTVHGPEEFDKATILGLREKIEHSAFTVAITHFCKSQLFRWARYEDWPKIKVVRCGLDDVFLGDPVEPAPDVARLVCIGRLCEQKGQLLLVEAAAELKRRGQRFELVLVGDGEMRGEVENMITQHDLQDTVYITGWATASEIRTQLRGSRALVCASFAEGLPAVIQEAFALGRPSLSTYIAGIPELVRDNETGWLVYAGDASVLTNKMAEVLDTPIETIRAMGQRARQAAEAMHDAKTEAGKLLDAINAAAASEQPQPS